MMEAKKKRLELAIPRENDFDHFPDYWLGLAGVFKSPDPQNLIGRVVACKL